MNELEHTNSAERLLAVLQSTKPDTAYWETLPEALGYQVPHSRDTQEKQRVCLRCLAELHDLYQQFVDDMEKSVPNGKQAEVILSGLKGLDKAIYPSNMESGVPRLSEAQVSLLRVAATVIPQEESLTEDDITRIRESISDLRQTVEQGNISSALRKALLELIRLSEDAISRYKIHGARALRRAFKDMLGEVAEAWSQVDPRSDCTSPGDSAVWTTIQMHLTLFDAIASKVSMYLPMAKAAARFLLGGSEGTEGDNTLDS